MEKIVNMQMRPRMPYQLPSNVQETKDDFIRLLQQQKESARQPEEAEDTKQKNDVKDAEIPEEKQAEEPVKEQAEETEMPEKLPESVQAELQQSILQQTALQITEPVADQQFDAEDAADVLALESGLETEEVLTEMPVLQEQPKTETMGLETQIKALETEVKTESAKAEDAKAVPEKEAEISGEEFFKLPVREQSSPEVQEKIPEKQEAVLNRGSAVQEELSEADMEQSVSVQTSEASVQAEQTQHVQRPEFRAEENTVKSTVEELPQELGKAVSAGKPGDSHTLTVELEPASLGKLTIRLEYEAGKTLVSVMASNPKTLELLGEKASEIAAILKEHTGEETVIYTEQPQKESGEEAQEQNGRGGQQQERQQHRQEEQPQTDSFMQQLRLGLV